MIPSSQDAWSYNTVESLCKDGNGESDRHDFKLKLPDARTHRKICCSFANAHGGFLIYGVKDEHRRKFEIFGLDADKELHSEFMQKLTVAPDIYVPAPKIISIPQATKFLYVFEIPQSLRRPHLPVPPDERTFWRRQGPNCVQMTLEEIRYQINMYEEKREKLALLLVDLLHKLRALESESNTADGAYTGHLYSFDTIDRIVVEAFSFLRGDMTTVGLIETLRTSFVNLNARKQILLNMLALSYSVEEKVKKVSEYREAVRSFVPTLSHSIDQIERSFREKFGVENPYSSDAHG